MFHSQRLTAWLTADVRQKMKSSLPITYGIGASLITLQAALAIAITAVQGSAWVWQLRASHGFVAVASAPIAGLFSYAAFAIWKRRSSALSLAIACALVSMSLAIFSGATEYVLQKKQRDAEQWLFYMIGSVVLLLICATPALLIRWGIRSAKKEPNQAVQTTPGLRPSVSDL